MTNFCSLPRITQLKIMKFLSVGDILNMRLTCSLMLELSNCESFFKRVKIQFSNLSVSDITIFKNLCDKYASVFALKINHFDGDINAILAYIINITEVMITVKHLRQICHKCRNIKTLTIDVYEIANGHSVAELVDFRCLSKLELLDELVIGEGNKRNFFHDVIDKSMLYDIFTSTNSISKIKFMGYMRIEGQDFKRHPDEQKLIKSLKEVTSSSHHITEWIFFGVFIEEHIFQFPSSIKILKRRLVRGFDFSFALSNSLEEIGIDGSILKAKNFKLPYLKVLEIYGDLYDPGDMKNLFLPNLEMLHIYRVSDLPKFEPLLLPTLKTLTVDPTETLNDTHMKWLLKTLLSKCDSLLCLVIDRCHSSALDQSLRVSESCLIDLMTAKPSLNIKIVDKWQTVLISAKNFDVAFKKIKHLLI